ncbi:type II toxin-antitoxin system VapB family antitoxin [Cereibacter changlensis]|nr:type II toxin-antitoxin system VapB family antitoxin [Cereibacter changlensis]
MPLYISDDAVNDLAERPAALTGENKTEAVRSASEKPIEALQKIGTLQERVAPINARARAAGIVADGSDDKALMDDLSGGL